MYIHVCVHTSSLLYMVRTDDITSDRVNEEILLGIKHFHIKLQLLHYNVCMYVCSYDLHNKHCRTDMHQI